MAKMAEIVSLNQYRKERQQVRAASKALQNRVRHGRTSAEKHRDKDERDRQATSHDDMRLERTDTPTESD